MRVPKKYSRALCLVPPMLVLMQGLFKLTEKDALIWSFNPNMDFVSRTLLTGKSSKEVSGEVRVEKLYACKVTNVK